MARSLRAVASLAIAISLATIACTGAPSPSPTQPGPPGTGAPSPAGSTPPEPVTLNLLGLAGSEDEYWNNLITAFQAEYPHITVKREVVPGPDFNTKFNAYVSDRSGADLASMQAGLVWFPYIDALQPLPELADLVPEFSGSENFCKDFDCAQGIYGIPYNGQGYVLYYNKQILTAAGLDPESPPSTWQEMADACTAIKAAGKLCWALGMKDYGNFILNWTLVNQTMTVDQYKGLGDGTVKWTDPAPLASIQLFEDAVKKGWFNEDAAGIDHGTDATAKFTSGEAAFIHGFVAAGSPFWSQIQPAIGAENLGVLAFPSIEADNPLPGVSPGPLAKLTPIGAATAWSLTSWSTKKDAALLWIRFVASQENQQAYFPYGIPSRKGLDASQITDPAFKQLQALAETSNGVNPVFLFGFKTTTAINDYYARILLGTATAQEAAEALAEAQAGP